MAELAERGQILLIGGLLLAVSIIVLALVFNSAVFTSTQAGQAEQDVSLQSELALQEDVKRHVATLIRRAEARHPGDRPDQEEYVRDNLSTINSHLKQYAAGSERIVEVSWNDSVPGKTVFSNDTRDDFQNRSSGGNTTGNWTVISSIDDGQLREFQLDIQDANPPGAEIHVEGAGGTGADRVLAFDVGDGNGTVEIGGHSCHRSGPGNMTANVTSATINGERCNALDFFSHLESPYSVKIKNGSRFTGNFTVTTDDTTDPDHNRPRTEDVLYGALIDVEYYSPSVEYNTTLRVAPGEPA